MSSGLPPARGSWLRKLYYRLQVWRYKHFPNKCVGEDKMGNRYYLFRTHPQQSARRWIKYHASLNDPPYPGNTLPVIWWSWLHYQRAEPPQKGEEEALNKWYATMQRRIKEWNEKDANLRVQEQVLLELEKLDNELLIKEGREQEQQERRAMLQRLVDEDADGSYQAMLELRDEQDWKKIEEASPFSGKAKYRAEEEWVARAKPKLHQTTLVGAARRNNQEHLVRASILARARDYRDAYRSRPEESSVQEQAAEEACDQPEREKVPVERSWLGQVREQLMERVPLLDAAYAHEHERAYVPFVSRPERLEHFDRLEDVPGGAPHTANQQRRRTPGPPPVDPNGIYADTNDPYAYVPSRIDKKGGGGDDDGRKR